MDQKSNPQEQRAIGYLEGRLEGLATKEHVQEAIDRQTERMDSRFDKQAESMDSRFDKQAERMDTRFDTLEDAIKGVQRRQTKALGVAVGIAFLLSLAVGAGNLAVNLGLF